MNYDYERIGKLLNYISYDNLLKLYRSKKINKLGILIFTLCLILFTTIILLFSYKSISTYNFRDFLNYFSSIMFVSLGIYYSYKKFFLHKILTKNEYEYYTLNQKEQCLKSEFKIGQKIILFANKHEKVIGILFILLGITGYFLNLILIK